MTDYPIIIRIGASQEYLKVKALLRGDYKLVIYESHEGQIASWLAKLVRRSDGTVIQPIGSVFGTHYGDTRKDCERLLRLAYGKGVAIDNERKGERV